MMTASTSTEPAISHYLASFNLGSAEERAIALELLDYHLYMLANAEARTHSAARNKALADLAGW